MIQALLLIARWIGLAHDSWRSRVAHRRPLAAEVDVLLERLERLRAENEILRARLLRMDPRRRDPTGRSLSTARECGSTRSRGARARI